MHRRRDEQLFYDKMFKILNMETCQGKSGNFSSNNREYGNCRMYKAAHVVVTIASTKETLPNQSLCMFLSARNRERRLYVGSTLKRHRSILTSQSWPSCPARA